MKTRDPTAILAANNSKANAESQATSRNMTEPVEDIVDDRASRADRLLRILFRGFGLLPPRFTIALFRGFARTAAYLCPRDVGIAKSQIRFALQPTHQLTEREISRIAYDSFAHLGESVAELLYLEKILELAPDADQQPATNEKGETLPPAYPKFARIEVLGAKMVYAEMAKGKPILALTGHMSNFEVLSAFHSRCGVRLTVIGREPNYSMLSRFIDGIRRGYGTESVWRHGKTAVGSILRALKTNRTIAFLIDHDANLENIFAPFFGLPAASPLGPFEFALRNELTVIASFITRVGHLRYQISSEIIPYDAQSSTVKTEILQRFNEMLEARIRAHPSQWLWWHRRWRRRPGVDYRKQPNALRSTREYLEWLPTARQEESGSETSTGYR